MLIMLYQAKKSKWLNSLATVGRESFLELREKLLNFLTTFACET